MMSFLPHSCFALLQDLFTQAEYFAEEGAKLFKAVKDFSQNVSFGIYVITPVGTHVRNCLVIT